jgi:hypothetical protein
MTYQTLDAPEMQAISSGPAAHQDGREAGAHSHDAPGIRRQIDRT